MSTTIHVEIEISSGDDLNMTSCNMTIEDKELSKLAIAIFHAKVYGLFTRASTLIEHLKNLGIQSLF